MRPEDFAKDLIAWGWRHGRRDLPWQRRPTPYGVWVSEVMLQQTQVATVIPYFQRFMEAFPSVRALASAGQEEVLASWSGLGYYARARNLHRGARAIVDLHGGEFPDTLEGLCGLPGVGRYTAGAILCFAFGRPAAAVDGNVKRVLARYHRIATPLGRSATEKRFWELAERYVAAAADRPGRYTQALLDLGATLCTRARPDCPRCPVRRGCGAHAAGAVDRYPVAARKPERPVRSTRMLLISNGDSRMLLERRPPTGVWGGLWSLPECDPQADVPRWCRERFGLEVHGARDGAVLRHSFTHFHLDILPTHCDLRTQAAMVTDRPDLDWVDPGCPGRIGLPAPVRRLLSASRT